MCEFDAVYFRPMINILRGHDHVSSSSVAKQVILEVILGSSSRIYCSRVDPFSVLEFVELAVYFVSIGKNGHFVLQTYLKGFYRTQNRFTSTPNR